MNNTNKQTTETPHILLIDDDEDFRHALTQSLTLANYQVEDFDQPAKVLAKLAKHDPYVIITDIRMPDMDGMECLDQILAIDPTLPVILITGHGNISSAVEAMRAGAYDFIEKPFAIERLTSMIDRAFERRRLVLENHTLRNKLAGQTGLQSKVIGSSEKMEKLRTQVSALASAPVDVLLRGETGSGKEVIARALHDEGDRADKPFVAINCGAIPLEMMESELFGHEAGAFTSANKARVGRLAFANGGTVFLDEIESMPMELQIKMLRVIETRSLEPLGSNKSVALDVRFVAASKVDLEKASHANEFRLDLYYRLNVVTIFIPPLRERKEDIAELCQHFLHESQSRYGRELPQITSDQLAEFHSYDWPGNVRELRNMVDRLCLGLDSDNDTIMLNESAQQSNSMISNSELSDLQSKITKFEAQLIEAELLKHDGNMKKTYEALGISRKSLYDKIQKYRIQKPTKKP